MKHIKMKDIPREDRPYERCLREGPETLSDAELLSVIIRTGSRDDSSLTLAGKILALNYPQEGILGLLRLSAEDFMSVKGIGRVKAVQLTCIGELSRRIWKREAVKSPLVFQSPQEIADFYMEDMRHKDREEFHLMLFNTKQHFIRDILLSKGTVNASLASPREIMIEALRWHAVNLALVHNHPSGDPAPSNEDIRLTKRAVQAAEIIGIRIIDHIIIGDNSYISLKERGLL